ncbi:MAG: hypothetical protein E7233_06870 [Lachnospiraceae bacterium]|nr:hypothetical protein [Lachnospiraceae bacterium]
MASRFSRESRFNRYFEGYEQRVVTDANGKEKMKMVYIMDYYRPRLTEKGFLARKIINIVLFLIAAAAQIYSGLRQDIPMNLVKYMGFAQCLGILAMILVVIYMCSHLSAPYNMEVRAHRNAHEKLSIMAMIGTFILLAIFITAIVTMIILKAVSFTSFVWAFMYLLAAACLAAIWLLEKRTEYDRVAHNSPFY